jgi:hypothetical protein
MPMTLHEIDVISRDVIRQYASFEFVAVTTLEGGSSRVELLVAVRACLEEPCRMVLNLPRAGRAELESELRRQLRDVRLRAG